MTTGKTKVFFLSTSLNIGGTEKFITALIENMSGEYDFSVGYLKEKGETGKYLEGKGIPVMKFPGPFNIRRYLRVNNIALMHTFMYRANIIGRFAAHLAGLTAVISTQQAIDAWKNPFFAGLDGFTSRWCAAIIANSEAAKKTLVSRDGVNSGKISVVYNGLDSRKFAPLRPEATVLKELGIDKSQPVIVSTTRLHREKGADLLPEIARATESGIFVVAGDGPEKESIREKVRALGISNRFLMPGWVSDISGLLSIADIFIMPSREESFPQSILEAMASSLPVVAADVGGVKELVEHGRTGLLAPPRDTGAFAAALNALLKDPRKMREMGAAGCKRSLDFTEEKMISSIKTIYQDVLRRENAI